MYQPSRLRPLNSVIVSVGAIASCAGTVRFVAAGLWRPRRDARPTRAPRATSRPRSCPGRMPRRSGSRSRARAPVPPRWSAGNGEARLMAVPSSVKISPGNPTHATWSPSAITCTSAGSGLPARAAVSSALNAKTVSRNLTVAPASSCFAKACARSRSPRFEMRRVERHRRGSATCSFAPATGVSRVYVFTTSPARIVPIRAASPWPFCGSLLFTSMWLMLPAAPIVNSVSMPAPLTWRENGRERVGVVGRRLEAADGVLVQREVDVGRERLAFVGFEQHDRQFRIDRPRRPRRYSDSAFRGSSRRCRPS